MTDLSQFLKRRTSVCNYIGKQRKSQVQELEDFARKYDTEWFWSWADRDKGGTLDSHEMHAMLAKVEFKRQLSPNEVHLLAKFAVLKDQELHRDEFSALLVCGQAYALMAEEWASFLEGPEHYSPIGCRVPQVLALMRSLNGGMKVAERESIWAEYLANAAAEDDESEAALALLMAIAFWYTSPKANATQGIYRELLVERLELEHKFETGMITLVTTIMMFLLLIFACLLAGKGTLRRQIRDNLTTSYNLGSLDGVNDVAALQSTMQSFSVTSVNFAPLSNAYLQGSAEFMIQNTSKTFTEPVLTPNASLGIKLGNNFTFQAWIQLDKDELPSVYFDNGGVIPIARRELSRESDSSCWSWTFPPGLAFGAHDYGGTEANGWTDQMEEYVNGDYTSYSSDSGEYSSAVLHTMVVNGTHVTFYQGDGSTPTIKKLTRPVTDCIARIWLGSNGLTITDLRFFPWAITVADIAGIYSGGSSMNEIGYSLRAPTLDSLSDIDRLGDKVVSSTDSLPRNLDNLEQAVEKNAGLTSSAVLTPTAEEFPFSDSKLSIATVSSDAVVSSPAWLIYPKTVFLYNAGTSSSAVLAPNTAIPSLTSAGFTISVWVKAGRNAGYLFGRALPQTLGASWTGWKDYCWYTYVGNKEDSFIKIGETSKSRIVALVRTATLPGDFNLTGKSFRHFVFRVNPANATRFASLCIDGVCESQWHVYQNDDNDVPRDCETLNRYNATGNNFTQYFLAGRPPANNWPSEGYYANARYFPRALSDQEISTLFLTDPDIEANPIRPMKTTRGCRYPQEISDQPGIEDDFGHDCYWYYTASKADPLACQRSPWALRNCPVVCKSIELCFGSIAKVNASNLMIWKRQTDFKPAKAEGTMCVASSTTPQKVAIECAKNIPSSSASFCQGSITGTCTPVDCSAYESDDQALLACLGNSTWPLEQSVRCRDILLLSDPYCAWDDTALRQSLQQVTSDANTTGQWAVQFWYETLNSSCADPRIRLFDGKGALVASVSRNTNNLPDSLALSDCSKQGGKYYLTLGKNFGPTKSPALSRGATIYLDPTSPGDRHLLTFGIKASQVTSTGQFKGQPSLQVDTNDNTNDFQDMNPFPSDYLFRVINIAGPIRMSPVTVMSQFPTKRDLGSAWVTQLESQKVRTGPSLELQQQAELQTIRSQQPFLEKSALISPPLLIQSRAKAVSCKSAFANKVVTQLLHKAQTLACPANGPYDGCDTWQESNVYQCPGGAEDGQFFGFDPVDFQGRKAHVEYLSAITDHDQLLRIVGGSLTMLSTSSFIDTLTRNITILAIFYSIEFDIITALTIVFDTQGGKVQGAVMVEHYVALTGKDFEAFKACMIALFVATSLYGLGCLHTLRLLLLESNLKNSMSHILSAIVQMLPDFALVAFAATIEALIYVDKAKSEEDLSNLAGRLLDISWGDSQDYEEKRKLYLNIVEYFGTVRGNTSFIESWGMALAIVLLFRVVLATSAHPRIASVTSTFHHAFDQLAHFLTVFAFVFCGFALIGTWRFGERHTFFATFFAGCKTQFDAMLGPPGSLSISSFEDNEVELLIFTLLFQIMCFLFLMNFVLAIIVEAYGTSQENLEASPVEQSMLYDLGALFMTRSLSLYHRWPSHVHMIHHLKNLESKFISVTDLQEGGFKRYEDAEAFYTFFERFDYMTGLEEQAEENMSYSIFMTARYVKKLANRFQRSKSQQFQGRDLLPQSVVPPILNGQDDRSDEVIYKLDC